MKNHCFLMKLSFYCILFQKLFFAQKDEFVENLKTFVNSLISHAVVKKMSVLTDFYILENLSLGDI